MPDAPQSVSQDPQSRYLRRIERRLRVIQTLERAGFGIYLPPDAGERRSRLELLARLIARQSELPALTRETFAQATTLLEKQLQSMQKQLPSDVQYRNRIRSNW
ncbi:MAG: hypothetical protein KDF24_04520 [Rhodocyclaceae bacterium]|nr:hypothetical protein [Rhodocyclaceae bacterium]